MGRDVNEATVTPVNFQNDLERFQRDWIDYVIELGGYTTEQDAVDAFTSTIGYLRRSIGAGVALHRAIIASSSDAERFASGLCVDAGRYWSESRAVADEWTLGNAYQDEFPALREGVRLLLSCHAEAACIDWVETTACRLGSSYEEEVRLVAGTKVLLTDVDAVWGHHMNTPHRQSPAPSP